MQEQEQLIRTLFISLDRRACLDRTKALLASGDNAALRYAALELRLCIEDITYDKLCAYAKRLPSNVLSRWQPPQAMAALLELEKGADQDYTLYVARESSPGIRSGPYTLIGQHRSLKLVWLRSAYHLLGNVLHAPHLGERRPRKYDDPARLRVRLDSIAQQLEPIVEGTLTSTMDQVVEFTCQLCGRKVVANSEAARRRKRVVCLHTDCQVEHDVREDENRDLWFTVSQDEPTYTCKGCARVTAFPRRRIVLGAQFACPTCGHRHEVVSNYASLEQETTSV
jgi:hypothetical protein